MTNTPLRIVRQVTRALVFLALVCLVVVLAHSASATDPTSTVLLANFFATPSWVMRKSARRLVNNCVFAGHVNRSYDDEFRQRGVKMGDTVKARLPQRYEVTVGAVMNPTPLTDQTVDVKITDQSNIGMEYDSWSATLYVDDYMERYGNGAVDALVNNIDYTGLSRCYKQVAKVVGTPGVVPGSTGTQPQAGNQVYLDAHTKLVEAGAYGPYNAMLSADMHAYITNANSSNVFHPGGTISSNWKKGRFGAMAFGIEEWYLDENIETHTVGALGSTPLVNLGGQTGSAINVDGAGGAVVGYWLEGDVIQFAGCYAINPMSHRRKKRLADFVLTQDIDADGGGNLVARIVPELIVSGPWATCSASPANNAAVTTFGHASSYANVATPQGLIYNKDAFALVMADLILPRGLWVSERISNAKLGISIRMLKDHDVVNDVSPARLDTAHGWSTIRQELAVRVCA
jgi:coat protein Gp5